VRLRTDIAPFRPAIFSIVELPSRIFGHCSSDKSADFLSNFNFSIGWDVADLSPVSEMLSFSFSCADKGTVPLKSNRTTKKGFKLSKNIIYL